MRNSSDTVIKDNLPLEIAAEELGVSKTTLRRWVSAYRECYNEMSAKEDSQLSPE